MTKDDTGTGRDGNEPLATGMDIAAALGLLTRLPIRLDTDAAIQRGARSAWAWPIVGTVPAGLGVMVGLVTLGWGLPPIWAAFAVLTVQVLVTGAMHEDGLADTADGFWGGMTPVRRLEIMKDSRIGAYGVIALLLSLGLRAAALSVILPAQGAFWAVLVAGIVSRAPMVVLMSTLPNARAKGLSQSVGRVPQQTMWLGVGAAVLAGFVLSPAGFLSLIFWTAMSTLALAALAKQKVGGQTGDILGASQQITEIAVLAVFAATLI